MLEQFQLVRLRMQPLGLWVRLHREWIWNSSGSDPTWRCRWVCTSNWSTNSTALTDAASDLATTDSLPFGADFFTGDSGCGCSG